MFPETTPLNGTVSPAAAAGGIEINTAAKQVRSSGMRRKPGRKGDRPIDSLKCTVVIFFVKVGLLNLH